MKRFLLVLLATACWSASALSEEVSRQPAAGATVQQAPKATGVTVNGTRLKAASGFVLNNKTKNQVTAIRPGGAAGSGITADCSCMGGTGTCFIPPTQGPTATCQSLNIDPCSTCGWTIGGGTGQIAR
jgi:hypothetical protein